MKREQEKGIEEHREHFQRDDANNWKEDGECGVKNAEHDGAAS